MKSRVALFGRRAFAAVAAAMLLTAGACTVEQQSEPDVEFDRAVAGALADGKLLIASFTADWCGPCKQMEATTWKDAELLAWVEQHAVRVRIDVDDRPGLAGAHEVRSIPLAVVLHGDVELGRLIGSRDAAGMIEWLDGLRERRDRTLGTADKADVDETGS